MIFRERERDQIMFPTGIKLQIFEYDLHIKRYKYEIQQLSTNNPAVRKIFNRNLCINNSNNNIKNISNKFCQFGFTQKSPGAIGEKYCEISICVFFVCESIRFSKIISMYFVLFRNIQIYLYKYMLSLDNIKYVWFVL